jgi:hypothetical protein
MADPSASLKIGRQPLTITLSIRCGAPLAVRSWRINCLDSLLARCPYRIPRGVVSKPRYSGCRRLKEVGLFGVSNSGGRTSRR